MKTDNTHRPIAEELSRPKTAIRWLVPSQETQEMLEEVIPLREPPTSGKEVKRSRSRLVVQQFLRDGRSVYLKRYKVKTPGRKAASLVHPSKVKREYTVSQAALERGLPVAPVIGAAEIRQSGFLVESYIAHEAVEPSISLQELLENPTADLGPLSRKELLAAVAHLLVTVQQKGLEHDDLKSHHILLRRPLEKPPQFVLIDLDGARLHSGPLGLGAILNNLAQLNRSLWKKVPAPAERLQFLRELIRVHPRLEEQGVGRLWRRVAVLSALRRKKISRAERLRYRLQFELGGQIPRELYRILRES